MSATLPAESEAPAEVTQPRVAAALGITPSGVHVRAAREGWPYRKAALPGRGRYACRLYPVSALPPDVREALADCEDPAALLRRAAPELLERLRVSTEELQDYRDCIHESSTAPDGSYSSCDESDEAAVRELDEVIAANRAAMARAEGEETA